jgi:DNA primase
MPGDGPSVRNIDQETIHRLLSSGDLVELVRSRIPDISLRKSGKNYSACCPFHSENTPSFTINPEKQLYYCFGCRVGGNAINFLMDYDHFSFREAVQCLAQQWNFPLEEQSTGVHRELYQIMQESCVYYQAQLSKYAHANAYLKSRQLPEELIQCFSIGYAPPYWDALFKHLRGSSDRSSNAMLRCGLVIKKSPGYYDRFRDRIIFPIRDHQGRIIGFGGRLLKAGQPKYLNSPASEIFNKSAELYGLYEATRSNQKSIIVVEGYLDALTLTKHGFKAVATMGTAMSITQMKRLFHLFKEVIICFDGDQAGKTAAWRTLEMSLPIFQDGWSLRFIHLPSDDPDRYLNQQGPDAFKNLLNKAQPFEDFLFNQLTSQQEPTLAGKTRFVQRAQTLIKKMPRSLTQHQLLDRLSRFLDVDRNQLEKMTQQKNDKKIIPKKTKPIQRPAPLELAIILLIQYPKLIDQAHESFIQTIQTIKHANYPILTTLMQQLKNNHALTPAIILEKWRDHPSYEQIKQWAYDQIMLPEHCIESEFKGILEHLKKQINQSRVENLLQKAKQLGLNTQEKNELINLLQETVD